MTIAKFKRLISITALLLCSSSLMAVPTYTGNTAGNPHVRSDGAGYYIWSNTAQTDWRVRWTGIDAAARRVNWWGEILFFDSNLGSTRRVSWDRADSLSTDYNDGAEDSIMFTARTNTTGGYDGFNFTLTSALEVLDFTLGSTLGEDEYGIYIGRHDAEPATVYDSISGEHSFKIAAVPEPASLALIGLGLLGLGLARKKAK